MKPFLSATILAAVMVFAAGKARGANGAALVDAIRNAPDMRSAGSAYVDARRADRKNPEVYRAYIRRLLALDQARLAYLPAKDLLELKLDDPLALGVIGYTEASRNRLPEAYDAYIRAAATGTDNAGILYCAGIACAWQRAENPDTIPVEATALAARHRATWATHDPFVQGQAVAGEAYKKHQHHLAKLNEDIKDAQRKLRDVQSQGGDSIGRYKAAVSRITAAAAKMQQIQRTIDSTNRATGGASQNYQSYLAKLQRDYALANADRLRAIKEARTLMAAVKKQEREVASAQQTVDTAQSNYELGQKLSPEFPWLPPTVGEAALSGGNSGSAGAVGAAGNHNAPPPENLPKLVEAIVKAPTLSDAGTAYATACQTARHCPQVHHAFVELLLAAGQPVTAVPAARQLAELDPADPLGQGVLGYHHAKTGTLAKAYNATVRAGAADQDNPGILTNLAFLTLWRQADKSAAGIDSEADTLAKEHLGTWKKKKPFQDAQIAAAKSIAERFGAIAQAKTRLEQAKRALDDAEQKDPNAQFAYNRAVSDLTVAQERLQAQSNNIRMLKGRNPSAEVSYELQKIRRHVEKAQIAFNKATHDVRETTTRLKMQLARVKQAQRNLERAQAASDRAESIAPRYDFQPPTVEPRNIPARGDSDTTTTAKPAPTSESADEVDAAKQLKFSKMLLANNRRRTAIEKLKALVEKYPDTPAGREAHTMLTAIYSGRK